MIFILVLSTALVAQAGQVPVVSNDPMVQRSVEGQLGAPSLRLDPNARVTLSAAATPIREHLDAVSKAGGLTLRYASDVANLDATVAVAVADKPVEEALRTVLKERGLGFQAAAAKAAFIYPDTPANREKYTATIRVFQLAKADAAALTVPLNRTLKPTSDGFRPTVVTVRDSNSLVVRAIPELMTSIAAWIAENDKAPAGR